MSTDLSRENAAGASEAAYDDLRDRVGEEAWAAIETERRKLTRQQLAAIAAVPKPKWRDALDVLASRVHFNVCCLDDPPMCPPNRYATPDHYEDVISECKVADILEAMGLLHLEVVPC